jgi:hypothetical protein
MENRKQFKFYRSYWDIAKEINNAEDRAAYLMAICEYQFTGVFPELLGMAKFALLSQKHSLDKQVEGFIFATETPKKEDAPQGIPPIHTPEGYPQGIPLQEAPIAINNSKETIVNNKEEINKTKQTIFSPIVEDVFNFSLDFFPENLHPKTQKEIDSWKTTIKQLHEIDGHDYDTIRHLIQKTREDDFWSKNFLSVNKLRKNDKNGVKYFDVFFEKFKIGNNGKQGTDFAHLIRISEQFRKKPNVG